MKKRNWLLAKVLQLYVSQHKDRSVTAVVSIVSISVTANGLLELLLFSAAQDTVQLTVQHSTSEHAFISMAKKKERRK